MNEEGVAPPGIDAVAVVGAVATMEEAVQASQMRFILAWAMRVEQLAKPAQRAGPAPVKLSWPPM